MTKIQEILEQAVKDVLREAVREITEDPETLKRIVRSVIEEDESEPINPSPAKTCPKCGKTDQKRLYEGTCRGCFMKGYKKKNKKVPKFTPGEKKPRGRPRKEVSDKSKDWNQGEVAEKKPIGKLEPVKYDPHPCGICGAGPDDTEITYFEGKGHACNDPQKACTSKLFTKAREAQQ